MRRNMDVHTEQRDVWETHLKKNMGELINLEHISLISGQVMPSNVMEYCTTHDCLTKELVIPGKLIQ